MISSLARTTESTAEEAPPHHTQSRRNGVLLINLGTPDSPEIPDVRRYLSEFLSDPAVIQLPAGLGWLNRPLGRVIAQMRAPKSAAMYREIWTERGSPLDSITKEQASLLAKELPRGWSVFFAMRYGRPSITETLEDIAVAGIDELVVVPMYPQYSGATTGTALRALYGALKQGGYPIDVTTRHTWYDDGGYIYAQAKLINEYVKRHQLSPDDTHLVFSAHGLPVSYVQRGDPYPRHVTRTVELVTRRLGWPADRMSLAYQSRLGPAKWLGPNTDETLCGLVEGGEKRVLVCPISFTVDCLETLEEIDVRYRAEIERRGGELYLSPALNTSGLFISALKSLVLRGPRPLSRARDNGRPLISKPAGPGPTIHDHDSLVMIGVSLPDRLGGGYGVPLVYASKAGLCGTKRSQREVPELLRRICEDGHVREGMVWNTCYRFEFYGYPGNTAGAQSSECIVRRVRRHLLGGNGRPEVPVNVLCGAEAWHHLMRTVVGLNSVLPGDRDVVEQLQTAHRLAQRAGTTGALLDRLVGDAVALERDVRGETEWGRFDPGYCYASLSNVVESTGLQLADCRVVVIGGSTTSRSVLRTLKERFGVPSRCMTLVYRGHSGGQIKELRKAVGNGRRIRVQCYSEHQVIRAIADADVVFFGIDRDEPVLDNENIRACRDFESRPLTVFDFNTFGSTSGLETIPGVRLLNAKELDEAAASFADSMCATDSFARAADAAEVWIGEHVPVLPGASSRPQRCYGSAAATGHEALRVEDRWPACLRCIGEGREVKGLVVGSMIDGC